MPPRLHYAPNARRGFTLVELLVVLVIIAILSSLTLAGLARAGSRSKADATKFMIRKLNDAILEHYETYEDLAITITTTASPHTTIAATRRARIREEMPDAWADVGPTANNYPSNIGAPKSAAGRAYARYRALYPQAASNQTFQGAECLYMIMTQSGLFTDFLTTIKADQIGDIDEDGAKEFLDGWKRPIDFMRWAPAVPSLLSSIQIADSNSHPDPIEEGIVPIPSPQAYATYPLISSSGPDGATGEPGAYGLVTAQNGWPDNTLNDICNFAPTGNRIVGRESADSTTYRDNITNHQLIAE